VADFAAWHNLAVALAVKTGVTAARLKSIPIKKRRFKSEVQQCSIDGMAE
jgi:hypothetical protein